MCNNEQSHAHLVKTEDKSGRAHQISFLFLKQGNCLHRIQVSGVLWKTQRFYLVTFASTDTYKQAKTQTNFRAADFFKTRTRLHDRKHGVGKTCNDPCIYLILINADGLCIYY